MHGFFVESIGDRVVLEGGEHRHLSRSLRVREGERVYLTDGRGNYAIGVVSKIRKDFSEIEVEERGFRPRSRRISIAAAIIKEDRLELMVEKLTELGTTEIAIFPSLRSQKRQLSSNKWERLRKAAVQAIKQSKGAWLPQLLYFSGLEEMLDWAEGFSKRYLLDRNGVSLKAIPSEREALGVAGPEGGFTEEEVEEIASRGFTKLKLADNVLRAETAALCFAALFLHGG